MAARSHSPPRACLAAALFAGSLLCAPAATSRAGPAPRPPAAPDGFVFSLAFHGPHAHTDPAAEANLREGLLNAFSFDGAPDDGARRFLTRHGTAAFFSLNGATRVDGVPAAEIEARRRALVALRAGGLDVSWNLLEEWDQVGGRWVRGGRPRYATLSRREAHAAFKRRFLEESPPLGTYLREPRARRGCPLVAQTDYAINAFDAFEMGVDLCLLERGIDELGDLSTGIAFVRGAARQHGRRWGIDVSVWRTGNESPTEFDGRGVLVGGWSPSYVRRHLYVAYLSGAEVVQLEPAVLRDRSGALNPLGEAVRDFADFALRRHRDVGSPDVPTAVLVDRDAGFVPRHWVHDQANAVWYREIPYSDGDHMLDNLLEVAYPGHTLHGLAPNAPFASGAGAPEPAAFREFLRRGGDPRPFEPMPATRWGDRLDVVTDGAELATLRRYRVVTLVGGVRLDGRLREILRAWVGEGGTLVVNVKQVAREDEPLLGVRIASEERTATRSTWLADGTVYDEPPFTFTRVVPAGAAVLAADPAGMPLVTSHALGKGRVLLTTPHDLQSAARDRLLRIGVRLLDWLDAAHATAGVRGPPVEYLVTRAPGRTLVAIVNSSATTWRGEVSWTAAPGAYSVREWVHDTDVGHAWSGGRVVAIVAVPAYDLAVYALQAR